MLIVIKCVGTRPGKHDGPRQKPSTSRRTIAASGHKYLRIMTAGFVNRARRSFRQGTPTAVGTALDELGKHERDQGWPALGAPKVAILRPRPLPGARRTTYRRMGTSRARCALAAGTPRTREALPCLPARRGVHQDAVSARTDRPSRSMATGDRRPAAH